MPLYIYQYPSWPQLHWDEIPIQKLLGELRYIQGKLSFQRQQMGMDAKGTALLETLTLDVVRSSEIEDERMDYNKVRSSIAKKLGLPSPEIEGQDPSIDGMVDIVLDAAINSGSPLSHELLCSWHASLFPVGYSGLKKIEVAKYRSGEMQIVSGAMGKEIIHYQAIEAKKVAAEMGIFLDWVNGTNEYDPIIKAAIAHLWFIIIHPFDDGNGRIARAITDMLLSRAEPGEERLYSMSNQILKERKAYYKVLQEVQYSDGNISAWLIWFLNCLKAALLDCEKIFRTTKSKTEFWNMHTNTALNARQRLIINKLFDGFRGKLKTSKWAKINKCSHDTALRDINDLIGKGILQKEDGGGRSTTYILVAPFDNIE